jgi:hypothetical protein
MFSYGKIYQIKDYLIRGKIMKKLFKIIILLVFINTILWFVSPGNSKSQFVNTNLININLSLSDPDSWVQMSFSNDNQTWSTPEPFATTKEGWDLTSNGGGTEDDIKCVYVKFQDVNGDWSEPISGCLILDTMPPTGVVCVEITS